MYKRQAVLVGLSGGWLLFGNNSGEDTSGTEMAETHDHLAEGKDQMWTCSMHSQIMQPEAGDCPICGMDLIPAEAGADGLAANEIKMTENAMALANIQTTIVGNSSVSEEDGMMSLSGKIETNEENNTVQASYFKGRIERLNVNYEGQKVNRGQLLATIYAPELVAAQQELLTASSLKETQPALYKAVRNKLKNWKLSEKQINAIEQSGNVRDNFPIYATVSGTVAMVMAAEGDYVNQGQPILKVSNLNSVWAEFDAYENQIAQFSVGQKVKVVANAFPNKEFDATISFIDPVLDNATRTVTVRATLDNRKGLFKPGMFVTAKIKNATNTNDNALSVPASAILWTGERSLVYLKTNPNEPVFEMRQVTLGNRNGTNYSVIDGLENGDEIVTNGTFTVDAAAQLQGKKSMMNQSESDDQAQLINMEMELPEEFQKAFSKSIPSYLKMKDAFVDSDASQVSAFAKATSKSLKGIKTAYLQKMTKSHLTKSIEMLDAIAANNDLENQRAHFVILNENLVAIAMNLDNVTDKLYVQKCPMANNNKGAVWISLDEGIKNPYYGEQMLTCGSTIDEIK